MSLFPAKPINPPTPPRTGQCEVDKHVCPADQLWVASIHTCAVAYGPVSFRNVIMCTEHLRETGRQTKCQTCQRTFERSSQIVRDVRHFSL